MPRNTVYELTITTRSPLHIGTGQQLVGDFDFVYDKAKHLIYVVDAEVALMVAEQAYQRRDKHLRQKARQFDERPAHQQTDQEYNKLKLEVQQNRQLHTDIWNGLALDQLVEHRLVSLRNLEDQIDVDGRPLVRYILHGTLSRSDNINTQIKDVFGRPYIPGSSLKGAIRTALAWQHFAAQATRIPLPTPQGNRDKGKDADDAFERALFIVSSSNSKDAEAVRDVLRMLQVRDSNATTAAHIILAPIQIFGPGQAASVINVEAIAPATTFTASLQFDHYAFDAPDAQKRGLRYDSKRLVLEDVAQACRAHSTALLEHGIEYYSTMHQPNLEQFYRQLAQEQQSLGETSFLLQLGWGAGWHSKTYGDQLRHDEAAFVQLVHDYKLDEPNKRKSSQFQPGDRFPITRKVVLNNNQPWQPLGWIRVDMTEVQR